MTKLDEMAAAVEFNQDGELGEVVLAAPPLNLASRELIDGLQAAGVSARENAVRAVLIRAEGENFCAGADVHIFQGLDEAAGESLVEGFIAGIQDFESLGVPTVAAVNGLCLAAGLEIALSCDLIWAADDARLGLVEAVIGATPFGGGTQRLAARAGDGRAREAVLTGRTYDAQTMHAWGVVNRVLPAAELTEKARRFATELAAGPTIAHGATKEVLRAHRNGGVAEADRVLPKAAGRVLASEDLQNGVGSLLEKGPGQAEFNNR